MKLNILEKKLKYIIMGFSRKNKTRFKNMKVAKSTGFLFFILIFSLILFNSNLAYAKDIFFGTSGDQIILNGNVGVGTTAPTQALEIGTEAAGVNLKIKATLGGDITPTFIAGNWTATNGWSADGTNLVKVTNATAGTITPSGAGATPVVGTTYKVMITCSAKGAAAVTYTYGGVAGTVIAVGTITDYITASTVGKLIITGAVNSTATITAVDIYPLTVNTGSLYQNGNIRIAGELTGPAGLGGVSISPLGITYNRGALAIVGALSGVTTLSMGGALSGVTTLSMNNALSGVTTGAFSGAVTDTQSLTTTPTNGFAATAANALVGTPVRISPSVIWSGSAWNTAATKANAIEAYLLPVTGGTTSGSLVFANRTVNGAANSTEIMRLTTAGYVGVGTTAPGVKFDVNGALRSSSATISTIGAGLIMADASGNLFSASTSVATGIPSPSGITGQTLYSNGTNWIASNTLYNNGTNVGIGTTTATQKLYVAGNINVNTNGFSALFSTYKGANSDGYNILIGGGGQSSIGAVGETFKGSYNTATGDQALYSNTIGTENTATGFNALFTNTTGHWNTAYGSTALYNNISGTYNTATGYRALFTNTTGVVNSAHGGEALQDNTTGTYNAASGAGALMRNTTGSDNSALGAYSGRWIADGLTGNLESNHSVYLGASTKALANGDGNEIVIGYNAIGVGSDSVVLGNDYIATTVLKGNVGIGTTNPRAILHLSKDIVWDNTTNVLGQIFVSGATDPAKRLVLGYDTTSDFGFIQSSHVGDDLKNLALNPAGGLVGIGTTNPTRKLTVVGDSAEIFLMTGPNNNGLMLQDLTNPTGMASFLGYNGTTYNPIEFRAQSGAGSQLFLNTTGNIGIGTTNPTTKLYVSGDIYTTANMSALTITDRTAYPKDLAQAYEAVTSMQRLPDGLYDENNREMQLDHTGLSSFIKATNGERDLSASVSSINEVTKYLLNQFGGINSSLFVASTSGNIGINTTNPGVKLDVNGAFRSTSAAISAIGAGVIMADSSGNLFSTSTGMSATINTRKADNSGTCTITVKNGLVTATTCP